MRISLIFLLSVTLAASLGASSQFSKLHSSPTGGDSGVQLAELFASDATGDDWFGHTVAVDGNTVVVSADGATLDYFEVQATLVEQGNPGGE